jgi:putative ABC transport system permease protein
MFKNYLKVAFRNIRRHKMYTIINVLGLTVAITSSLLIFLYVHYEFSYDKFHEKADRIYRVVSEYGNGDDTAISQDIATPRETVKQFIDKLPEVEDGTRI